MSVYYPSFSIHLGVRFDEALHVVPFRPPLSPQSVEDTGLPSLSSDQLIAKGGLPTLLSGQGDFLSYKTTLNPLRCTVDIPGYRQAGKFTFEVPFKDFPFEPELLRAVSVEIYAGAIPADEWSAGVSGPPPGGQTRTSQVAAFDASASPSGADSYRAELLVGIVDEVKVEHSEKGDTVSFEGRDLRGILIDLNCAPDVLTKLNTNQTIDRVVKDILDRAPLARAFKSSAGQGINVRTNPDDWPDKELPIPNAPSLMTPVNLGAAGPPPDAGAGQAGGSTVGQTMPTGDAHRMKLWDLITQMCGLVGAVPFFVGHSLWLRPARALYDPNKVTGTDPGQTPTPFKDGKPRTVRGTQGGDFPLTIRVMTYGRNIQSLKFNRKLAGLKVPSVHVVSLDTNPKTRGRDRYIYADWPPLKGDPSAGISQADADSARSTSIAPAGGKAQTDSIQISVPGIRSKARLLEIAKDVYEEIGRGETGGSCSTKDLASLGGDAGDADLLRLRPGDPVRFNVDNRVLQSFPPAVSARVDLYRQNPEQLAAILQKQVGDPDLARVLAFSLTGRIAERQSVYRVSNVRFAWDAAKGIGVDFDFQNYIESRAGVTTKLTQANQRRPRETVR